MISKRKCIGCGIEKPKSELLKITKDYKDNHIKIEPDSKIFGRSAYLCYNQECISMALKKNKLNRALKTKEDLKGLLNGQYQG